MKRALLLAAMTACVPATRAPQVREVALPAAFAGAPSGDSAATIDRRAFFADTNLNALIDEALANNHDLQLALARIEIARAETARRSGARLPRLGVAASASLRRFGDYTMDGAGNAATMIRPGERVPEHYPELFVGLQASWEPDLWGRLAKLHGAARARYLATVEGAHLVTSSLVADLAAAYFQLLATDDLAAITETSITQQTRALELMNVEKQAGRTTELAVQQFTAELAATRALRSSILRDRRALEIQLATLVGRLPSDVARTSGLLQREVPRALATGVPSDLLRARPDIRAAELEVQATRYDVRAARAAFYPRITITARLGLQAFDPRVLFSPASIAYGLFGGLVGPLFNRSNLRADLAIADAHQREAMVRYQQVVLRSFADVATQLDAMMRLAEVTDQQRQKLAALEGAIASATALFDAGKATYLDVLVAQQRTLDGRLELVRALRDQHVARVRLFKALGGGWQGTLAPARTAP